MVLEVAILNVLPNQSAEFEKAFAEAQAIISAIPGYQRHEFRRCVETPDRYLLLVRWKELLRHFYDPFSEVEHYTPL
ncbi:MAG: antibiotic biosynthesis monooxygenase [Deltaproteobacteria bacterium]|nr:MAG: antibiotic biosynthesis monooxygenase [Deltaproteobacteria bacterium]